VLDLVTLGVFSVDLAHICDKLFVSTDGSNQNLLLLSQILQGLRLLNIGVFQ
jgi:hypothetical protein